MNRVESIVYNLVKQDPRLKGKLRDIYQRACDFVPVRRTESPYRIEVRKDFFFGFHDKCPWSSDDQRLLAHRFSIPLRMPKPSDSVEIGFFSAPDYREFQVLGCTSAWNWHQGAMLQWLGGSSSVIFNDFDGHKHVACIVDVNGTMVETLPLPIAAVSPDGKKALSYNFARLRRSPYAYGYANGSDPEEDHLAPSGHGLYLVDLQSGKADLLFPIKEIAGMAPESSMRGSFHYFTHCQFSPSGKRFKFFHRWIEDGYKRWTRMVSCDLERGNDLYIFPTSGMVSHVAWRDEQHILAYARTKEYDDHYYLFTDQTDEFTIVGKDVLTSNGHPSFSKNGEWIITDTYPNRFRIRYLVLYNLVEGKRYNLAKLYSPREYSVIGPGVNLRCDLHPRWNRNDTMICFDSTYTGKRALCFVALGDLSQHDLIPSL